MRIKEQLNHLKEVDTYSLILFVLYKMIGIPEYSALSEMAYILDKENLLRFCEYFGGTTIKVPTINQLETLVYALLLYQHVNIDNIPYEEAIKLIGHKSSELREVKSSYNKLCDVLSHYNFNLRKE